MVGAFVDTLADLKEKDVLSMVKERLDAGEDPLKILEDCRAAMEIVGERYDGGVYFIPDLVIAGEILSEIVEMVKPRLEKGAELKRLGKVVIGTVEGDIHDIGKNIVAFILEANGFELYDLGVDVPSQKFVEKIKEVKPQIVAMSGLLTLSYDSMKRTVEAIKDAGLRDKVKIMIGGSLIDESIVKYVGADATRRLALEALKLAKEWVGG